MPVYVYECGTCHHIIERDFKREDKSRTILCPYCDAMAKRIITPISIIFKGDGFYSTDNK